MRTCTKCSIVLPIEEFAFKNKGKNIRASWCKICQRAYAKSDYRSKTDYYKAKGLVSRQLLVNNNKKYIKEYLEQHPCVDCGESDIQVLEFDHIEMLLSRAPRVTNLISSSLEKIKAEIEKCQVRCANCHTRRTRVQMGWLR